MEDAIKRNNQAFEDGKNLIDKLNKYRQDAENEAKAATAAHNSPLTKSSHLEKDTSYGIKKQDWHTAYGTADRANRLRQRADKRDRRPDRRQQDYRQGRSARSARPRECSVRRSGRRRRTDRRQQRQSPRARRCGSEDRPRSRADLRYCCFPGHPAIASRPPGSD